MGGQKKYQYVRKSYYFEGKQYFVSAKTESEAYEKLGRLKASLERGGRVVSGNSTVGRWYEEWRELYKAHSEITANSLRTYDIEFYKHINPVIGAKRLKDIRDVHLQAILNSQAGKSYSHVSKLRMVIQALFKRAAKSRLIRWDPSEDLTLPRYAKGSHRPITREERECILKLAETHPSGLWVLTILYTGMRPGETAALQWKDIDTGFQPGPVIHVTKAMEGLTGKLKEPKTKASVRDIPILPQLLTRLEAARGEPGAPVFPTEYGNFQNSKSLRRKWLSFKRELDIMMGAEIRQNKITKHVVAEDLTPYCLRHTFCTDLEAAGVPINIAKYLMGHATIEMTSSIYTHRQQPVMQAGMDKLTEYIQNPEGKYYEQIMQNAIESPLKPCDSNVFGEQDVDL